AVERITYGLLNLSHRAGSENLRPLQKGRSYDIAVKLNEIAQTVPAGCRLRVSLSTSYWPIAWPSPELATLTIDPSRSAIDLPVLESATGMSKVRFAPAEQSRAASVTVKQPGAETRHVIHDIDKQRTNMTIRRNDGTYVIDDIGTEITFTKLKDFAVSRTDPSGARSVVACTGHYRRGGWDARVETELVMTCDRYRFHLTASVKTFDDGKPFISRTFDRSFKRDHV
ncbi:MAG: hypothetical protein M3N38_12015, partial [Pseudomonadota bacterium]|nr:hypothetical protein [Pseudomonadota bacterium]